MSKQILLLLILVILTALVVECKPRRGRGPRPSMRNRRMRDQPSFGRMMRRWFSRYMPSFQRMGYSNGPWGMDLFFDWRGQKNWWNGPNVCTDRSEKNDTLSDEITVHHVTRSQFCDDSDTVYKCESSVTRNGLKTTVTEIKECCKGFSRKRGDFGCPTAYKLQDIAMTASDLKLNEFVKAIQSVNLLDTLRRGKFTIFAPNDNAFQQLSSNDISQPKTMGMFKDMGSVVMVSEVATNFVLEDTTNLLLGHVTTDVLRSSRLNDEQLLETGSPSKTKIRINFYENQERLMTANCKRVSSRDNIASNGVIHIVEEILQPVSETISDIVSRNSELQYLKTAVGKSGLGQVLREDGQLTVFAPTDAAFRKLDPIVLDRLLNDQKCLQKVLQNHVLPNVICSSAIPRRAKTRNLLKTYLPVRRDADDKVFIQDSQVLSRDIMATNGVVHIIDEVLVPEDALNILDIVQKENATQVLVLLGAAGLKKTIQQASDITFFVPSDEAFSKLDPSVVTSLQRDPSALADVLKFHVSPTMAQCNSVYDGYEMDTLLPGKKITINEYVKMFYGPSRWVQTVQCAGIVKANIKSCNGVVHIVDRVLVPPSGTVVDVLALDSRFSRLVELVKRAGLADALQESGPFTVFAPTNDAFQKIPMSDLQRLASNKTELATLLKNHVIKGRQCCAGIFQDNWLDQRSVTTLTGERYRLRRENATPKMGNSEISECDLPATNGIVHVIDDVITRKQ